MLTVHADPSTLQVTPSGAITGVILLRGEELSFPDKDWSDAPVVLLGWWLEAVMRLDSGHAAAAHCRFMDGPFSFEAVRHGSELVLRCQRRRQDTEQTILVERVPFHAFTQGLMAAASSIVAACEGRGWRSAELLRLKDLVGTAEHVGAEP